MMCGVRHMRFGNAQNSLHTVHAVSTVGCSRTRVDKERLATFSFLLFINIGIATRRHSNHMFPIDSNQISNEQKKMKNMNVLYLFSVKFKYARARSCRRNLKRHHQNEYEPIKINYFFVVSFVQITLYSTQTNFVMHRHSNCTRDGNCLREQPVAANKI